MEQKSYPVTVAGVKRELPVVALNESLSVASFVILGDCELVCAAAKELSGMVPEADWIVTAEAKGIPLAHELARCLNMKRYIVARKSVKPYMRDPLEISVNSITTQKEQKLCLDGADAAAVCGKRVLLVDDVISTGESIEAISMLVKQAGGQVVGKVSILTEGDPGQHTDVIALGNLPLFHR
ncbi:phosphoribosyltransferase family protein [Bacilliculturomica massiliensis]|uniref:phosphoribosyltransferase family protein n=1 Tax=Bacilliculturomica massiliensis TaxID=1917867 RepID=UPI001032460C|nr:phosphoribosyltransferase family protein [Bacilliculturomica massiliensis]